MAVSLAISEILSVKQRPDLEIWVWGHSKSLKMARFDRPYMTVTCVCKMRIFNRIYIRILHVGKSAHPHFTPAPIRLTNVESYPLSPARSDNRLYM